MIALVILGAAQKPASASQNAALQYWQAFALMENTDISGPDGKQLDAILQRCAGALAELGQSAPTNSSFSHAPAKIQQRGCEHP